MNQRKTTVRRITEETNIEVALNLDGTGKYEVKTSVAFFNHMLELFSKHGLFDVNIRATGDLQVEEHHLVEDIGIVLGEAFAKAVGDKKGINRYGFFILPMDESLATVAIDISGRYSFRLECPFNREKVGDLPTELVYDFWDAFAQNAKMNLHIKVENGRNDHHKIEAIFKATARALRMACDSNGRTKTIPSTKGIL